MITIKGEQIPNSANEMNLGKFEKLIALIAKTVFNPSNPEEKADYNSEIEKWTDILVFAGASREVLGDLDLDEFRDLIVEFNKKDEDGFQVVKEVEIGGYIYRAFDEEFKINVSKWMKIEAIARTKPANIMGDIMAILFERIDLTRAENESPAHIKKKCSLFRSNMVAGVAIPYIAYVTSKLALKQKEQIAELSEQNESAE